MSVVVYDGTFEGFLTLLAVLFPEERSLEGLRIENERLAPRESDLFAEHIITQPELARAFYGQLRKTIPREVFQKLPLFYLCDQARVEIPLIRVLRASTKRPSIWKDLTNEHNMHLYRAERAFHRERHRWLGLLRFVELENRLLFARFEPSLNVLPQLSQHFTRRFPNENFLIFDSRRKLLFSFQHQRGTLLWVDDLKLSKSPGEDPFARLWQTYFTEIAVPERKNYTRQRGKLPLRVRPFLTEFWSEGPLSFLQDLS
ncbi:MAG: TIGR03915 family putative DNA repair protein [Candidatus Atribacteria bacterium]|nr:TIGR03915 family putative DNA repair protein [Candidatus Atribacteria bacterium]